MEERDAAKAKKLQEEFHGEQHDQSKHYKLLKTALLNLNEQMKETNSSSEEEISELLSKLDLVVRLLDVKAVRFFSVENIHFGVILTTFRNAGRSSGSPELHLGRSAHRNGD